MQQVVDLNVDITCCYLSLDRMGSCFETLTAFDINNVSDV